MDNDVHEQVAIDVNVELLRSGHLGGAPSNGAHLVRSFSPMGSSMVVRRSIQTILSASRDRLLRAGLGALLTVAGAVPAFAQADGDRHLWLQAVAVVKVDEAWRLHLEAQPRWFEDVSAPFQVLARTAVGRQMTPAVSLWAGHGWIAKPPGPGVKHEQRLWEQISASLPAATGWAFLVRWRQEQRWQEGWDGVSHRTRLMGRASHRFRGAWSAIVWDEAMVTLNPTGSGPVRGFDQNRLFGGVGRRLSPQVAIEGGYLWFALRPTPGVRSDNHVALVTANLNF